jgi:hypothetical protein
MPGAKYTRRVFKGRRKTKKRRVGAGARRLIHNPAWPTDPSPPPPKQNLTPAVQSQLQEIHEDEKSAVDDISGNITTKDDLDKQLRVVDYGRKYKLLTKLAELYEKLQKALLDSGLDEQQIIVLAKNELKRWVERDPMFRPNFPTQRATPMRKRLDLFED